MSDHGGGINVVEGRGGFAFRSLGLVFLVYSMRSHIHAWNMARG